MPTTHTHIAASSNQCRGESAVLSGERKHRHTASHTANRCIRFVYDDTKVDKFEGDANAARSQTALEMATGAAARQYGSVSVHVQQHTRCSLQLYGERY